MNNDYSGRILNIRYKQQEGRLEILDFLRGAAMILVLLHHSEAPYSQWILAFHMPLFFMLSGYAEGLREKQIDFFSFMRKKTRHLLLPYFLFEILNLLICMALLARNGMSVDLKEALFSVFMCTNLGYTGLYGRLWFWPCLFVCELYCFVLRSLARERKVLLWTGIAVVLLMSWCTVTFLPERLPFTMDTAFMGAVFFLVGYERKKWLHWLTEETHLLADIVLCMVLFVVMHSCVRRGATYLMVANRYGPFLWSVLGAFAGCGMFLVLAKWLYRMLGRISLIRNFVLWYGTNSLAVFPVHLAIKIGIADMLYYQVLASNIGILLQYSGHMTAWYVLFPAMLVGSIPIVNIITCYFPFLLGKMPGKVRLLTNRPE